ncbi:MAG: peptidoglycan DD-metalloendopeptidase family protein [Clostridia bacterium]|mgnify:FL=1
MEYISIKKLKFYTKETIKFFNIALIAIGFIIAIILIKYKPMYEVKIEGTTIGYVENKKSLNEKIQENVENYSKENIESAELTATPEYELKLVNKSQDENEDEVIIALQNELEITYKYYEIASNNEVIENVKDEETAEKLVNEIKELSNNEVELTINEKATKALEEIQIDDLEVAKENTVEKLNIDTTESIADINGIKVATLPVTGTISSRYGVSSKIRVSTHTGLDIATTTGTPIKVVADGTITFAAYSGSYGYLVKVDHGNGVETWYGHTSKMLVKEGQAVKAGNTIALVGSTGNSTGPHLHFEVRINGEHVNPQKYLYN